MSENERGKPPPRKGGGGFKKGPGAKGFGHGKGFGAKGPRKGPRPQGDRGPRREGERGPRPQSERGKDRPSGPRPFKARGPRPQGSARPEASASRPSGKVPGLTNRQLAVKIIEDVLSRGRALDDAFDAAARDDRFASLPARDRAHARLITLNVLRHRGTLEAAIDKFLERPLPPSEQHLKAILLVGAAELLLLKSAAHAAINLAVEQCGHDAVTERFAKLANAVLRRVSEAGPAALEGLDREKLDVHDWLFTRWTKTYGEATARKFIAAMLTEAPIDFSLKPGEDPATWAKTLGGVVLPTGTIRTPSEGRVEVLPGYGAGAWWVQDAAAALVPRLLGDVNGQTVADLCAAPGGKTAALVTQGARVTAVDVSEERLKRVKANLMRLKLSAELVALDAAKWSPKEPFDAILLDAPCTATGTIRRHPDILHLKRASDIDKLASEQTKLLRNAIQCVKVGGIVVYAVCSLEPEEGPEQIGRFLAASRIVERVPLTAGEAGLEAEWITPQGDLRTLPFHLPNPVAKLAGMDGFYAARLRRTA